MHEEDRHEVTFELTVRHTAGAGEPSPDTDDISALLTDALHASGFREVDVEAKWTS